MPKRIDNVICERQIKGGDTLPTYVSVIKFNVPDVGIRFEIKHNKDDEYEPFDNIKKGLLKVVKEWQEGGGKLKENMGRYEFVNLILELYTKALTDCEGDAFKVEYYEAKDQIGKYLDTNKKRIETLNRIKEENKELDKNIKDERLKQQLANARTTTDVVEEEKINETTVVEEEKPKRKRSTSRTKKTVETQHEVVVQQHEVVKPLDILPTSSWRDGMKLN